MKFAIINTWPDIKNAEYECIERLKIAAKNINAECFIVDMDGYLIDHPKIHITTLGVEFCLALHFVNFKIHNVFTYGVLWNPPCFIEDWDGPTIGCNILSYDDFVGYRSEYMLTYYNNLIHCLNKTIDISHEFVPGLPASAILNPKPITEKSILFYSGINWERIGNTKGRHHDLFMLLDATKNISIYGPAIFAAQKPWEGFSCYRGELPFDGVSAIQAINDCSISLVLSSDTHRISGTASNRIYESCAAGAVIISDDNSFVLQEFGDSVLSYKHGPDAKENFDQIMQHLDWIKKNPEAAKKLAEKSQAIFKERFTLEKSLTDLFANHVARQKKIKEITCDIGAETIIDVLVYANLTDSIQLAKIFESINQQSYSRIHIIITALAGFTLEFNFRESIMVSIITILPEETIGKNFLHAIAKMQGSFFAFLTEKCTWSADHLATLRKCLDEDNNNLVAYSAYFVEEADMRYFFGVPSKRHMYFAMLRNSNILNLNYHDHKRITLSHKFHEFDYPIPCDAFLFKKSLLDTLKDFPFAFLDDRNRHRYKLKLFLMESLKHGRLAFSKIATVLVNNQNVVTAPVIELTLDKDQYGLLQKKYFFDPQYDELYQRYYDSHPSLINRSLTKIIGDYLRRHHLRTFKILKFFKNSFAFLKNK